MKVTLFAALLCSLVASGTLAAETRFKSGPRVVTLIELYTSEGCSSCPPAEAWLNHLQATPGLWDRFIPVALHVDYWDELGWIDPFGRAAFSDRQRRYYAGGHLSAVYTPGMLIQGHEYQGWRANTVPPGVNLPPVGDLEVRVDGNQITARFSPTSRYGAPLRATAALLGFGLSTAIPAGENAGRTLQHDFVDLGQTSALAPVSHNRYQWRLPLPQAKIKTAKRLGLVVWVAPADRPTPVQAAGGYLN